MFLTGSLKFLRPVVCVLNFFKTIHKSVHDVFIAVTGLSTASSRQLTDCTQSHSVETRSSRGLIATSFAKPNQFEQKHGPDMIMLMKAGR